MVNIKNCRNEPDFIKKVNETLEYFNVQTSENLLNFLRLQGIKRNGSVFN